MGQVNVIGSLGLFVTIVVLTILGCRLNPVSYTHLTLPTTD